MLIEYLILQVEGAKILNIPLIATEQYPKGLGSTVNEIKDVWGEARTVFPKTQFTMMTPEVKSCIKAMRDGGKDVNHVVVFGIEVSHIFTVELWSTKTI